ncbi:MAG: response regulator [Bacillaceae bacterium]|nr:response regulator [Bacillaceae bacterium]
MSKRKKTVYIVDDQVGIQLLLKEIINNEGYHTVTFETANLALDHISAEKPDLLFVDYKLPLMTGVEMVHKLDELGVDSPVIMMTGLSEDEVKKNVHTDQVKEVLLKPFNIEEVKKILKKYAGDPS